METRQQDFAEFYRESKDECLVTVLVSVGDRETAQETRRRGVRPTVGVLVQGEQAPGTSGLGGPHRTERGHLSVAETPPGGTRS